MHIDTHTHTCVHSSWQLDWVYQVIRSQAQSHKKTGKKACLFRWKMRWEQMQSLGTSRGTIGRGHWATQKDVLEGEAEQKLKERRSCFRASGEATANPLLPSLSWSCLWGRSSAQRSDWTVLAFKTWPQTPGGLMPRSTSQKLCCQCPCPCGKPQPPPTSAGDPPTVAAVWLTGSWCSGRMSGLCLWDRIAKIRTLVHQRPPGSTKYQTAKDLPEISNSMLRPSSTQRPASYSAGHPLPNN